MVLTHGGNVFAIARERGWHWQDVIDFSANINPLGPSPFVKPAIIGALDRIVHYPEREPERLRVALAHRWAVDKDEILLGNGATELIFFLSRLFNSSQTTLALPVFSEFHRAFPESRTANLEDLTSWPSEGLLVLTRPSNPTGSTVPLATLSAHLQTTRTTLLVDESFLDFSQSASAMSLIADHPRLLVLRSLTKFYALPGLRIGALVADAGLLRSWKEAREPWQVNVLAEEAALAAVQDVDHASKSFDCVRNERQWLLSSLRTLPGVEPQESDANFIFVRLAYPADRLLLHLMEHKILVRNCAEWPGITGEAIRIAVRIRAHNERLINAWRQFPK